jgi:tetratricopeptide (TPR) repeat protein
MKSVAEAVALRNEEKHNEALQMLFELLNSSPNDPVISYEIGGTFDDSERCDQAIPFYRKALENGLKEERAVCVLALGSSHRAIGQYQEAREVLEQGVRDFPSYHPMICFLALTYTNLGESELATRALIKLILDPKADFEEIRRYTPALEYYINDFNEVLDPTPKFEPK